MTFRYINVIRRQNIHARGTVGLFGCNYNFIYFSLRSPSHRDYNVVWLSPQILYDTTTFYLSKNISIP